MNHTHHKIPSFTATARRPLRRWAQALLRAPKSQHGMSFSLSLLVTLIALTASSYIPTAAATTLPDGRAYELVSPPQKNGADVMADSGRTRAAADGSAISFPSLGGFGDALGTGIATEYLAERSSEPAPGTNGWSTHAITPAQDPLTLLAGFHAAEPIWRGEFSPDLSTGVFRAWSPVTNEDPNVANVENLYRRTDLRTPGAGSYQLVTSCPVCESPLPPPPFFALEPDLPKLAGASADFNNGIFESHLALTADADPGVTNLYEWTGGTVRLAGVLPDGTPAPISEAGQGQSNGSLYTPDTISRDGSRIEFTVPTTDGDKTGQLYQRIDGSSTLQVNASERTDCADHNPCSGTPEPDPNGTQPAHYETASTDGLRVFFTTTEQLTDDDTNSVTDLYLWDATAPAGHRLTRLSVDNQPADLSGEVIGVMGASDDGHYVYFIAHGQLVAGGPVIDEGIYAWHDGTLAYVGRLADDADTVADLPVAWGLFPLEARVTPDGRRLLFRSRSGDGLLSAHGGTDYDQASHCSNGECAELYVYSADTDALACASCNPSGAPATKDAVVMVRKGTGAATTTDHLTHPISDDGRFVFFSTAEAVVPRDSNGRIDAYEYDAQTGQVHLLTSGTDPSDSYFMDASADGGNVFVLSRQQLVGWDTDRNYDVYDVRVGGGFPEPSSPAPACAGETCQGSPAGPPPSAAPPSLSQSSAGNLPAPVTAPAAHKPSTATTKAQRLKRALRACGRIRDTHRRKRCETYARKRYGKTAAHAGVGR